jgi:hypothetical protein
VILLSRGLDNNSQEQLDIDFRNEIVGQLKLLSPVMIALFADGVAIYWLREFKVSVHPYENMCGSLFDVLAARLTIYEEVLLERY